MIFKEYGIHGNPAVILIHGGGLSDWMWRLQIEALKGSFYVVTPVLDGHGEESRVTFESISKSAEELIRYVETNLGGSVFALCGLSIGAQIAAEVLSRRSRIAQNAVIESALVHPSRLLAAAAKPMLSLSYPLVRKRWFAKLQAKQMYVPDCLFEAYFRDSGNMSRETLLNLTVENARFAVPENLADTGANTLVLCGEKEYGMMKESAKLLHQTIQNSTLKMIPDCGHGYSLKFPDGYTELLLRHFSKENPKQREDA